MQFGGFWCIIGIVGGIRQARFLNGGFTGGCATLRKEVVAMIKYILRIIFFIIIFLVAFTIKVK